MKQNKLKFLMSLVMILCSISASGYDFMVDGIAYNINGNEATVSCTVYMSYNNYTGLLVANIPETVTYNGTTYSVTSIGNRAFYGCTGLKNITIPNSVTSIGEQAFYDCRSLTSVTIPNSVVEIGIRAFEICVGLTSVAIPNSVISIGDGAFEWCTGLTSVAIPNSVISIGGGAFARCSGLTSVEIPNSVTSIGWGAFSHCIGLTNVTIPNSVTIISGEAFRFCTSLTSIHIPNSVTYIDTYAFSGCSDLTSIDIPNSVTTIGDNAFSDCRSLTSVEIPNSVTSIGDHAFGYCYRLKYCQFDAINCTIGNQAFKNVYLSNLQLGEQVEYIPTNFPSFYMDGRTLVLPNNVQIIDSCALVGTCDAVAIGDNIESIAAGAFSDGISVAYVSSTTPLPCSPGAFANPQTLFVPQGCRAKYFMSDGWCEFVNIIEGNYVRVTDLTLDVDSATMHETETLQLNTTVLPADHSATSLDWWSTNTAVATVNSTGLVTAVGIGEADIYCGVDNKTVVCHITVVENHIADSIQLNYTDLLLDWDNIVDLTASIYPENVDQSVTWTIPENDNIYARVVGNKLRVMPMRSGTVTVTATSVADPSVSADCVITIQIPDVNGDTSLNISDVTALIDYLLGGDPESINIGDADVNRDGNVNIADVTALIDKLLSGN